MVEHAASLNALLQPAALNDELGGDGRAGTGDWEDLAVLYNSGNVGDFIVIVVVVFDNLVLVVTLIVGIGIARCTDQSLIGSKSHQLVECPGPVARPAVPVAEAAV